MSSIQGFGQNQSFDSMLGNAKQPHRPPAILEANGEPPQGELHTAFQDFVGQTLFGSMLTSMRETLDKPAYMHGGRTEEVFQQQLDQILVEDITRSSAGSIVDPMFDLFNMQRRGS